MNCSHVYSFISFCMGIPLMARAPGTIIVFIFDLIVMVPAIYMGIILVQWYSVLKKRDANEASDPVVLDENPITKQKQQAQSDTKCHEESL
jgi:hypothetical protein